MAGQVVPPPPPQPDPWRARFPAGEGRVHQCLRYHLSYLSERCKKEELKLQAVEYRDIRLRPKLNKVCSQERAAYCKVRRAAAKAACGPPWRRMLVSSASWGCACRAPALVPTARCRCCAAGRQARQGARRQVPDGECGGAQLWGGVQGERRQAAWCEGGGGGCRVQDSRPKQQG